jgi:NAD(P)-dependent dehydrogenase (short-subunit alcohol dehydrogenase family)
LRTVAVSNPFSYAGKRVVVTGGASGVGAALVGLLTELGAAAVTVIDVKEAAGGTAYVRADLSEPESIDAAAAAVDGPVHALFNNAGVAATLPSPVVMSVNYLGPRRLTDRLIDRMPEGAAVTYTASIAGGQWPQRLAKIQELLDIDGWDEALKWIDSEAELIRDAYSFSKECVHVHVMRSSKATGARGIRTNSVCPGIIDTPLIPDFEATMSRPLLDWTATQGIGRFAAPHEIAAVLAFLGSDASAYLNGTNLIADAGFTAAFTTGQVDYSTLPS